LLNLQGNGMMIEDPFNFVERVETRFFFVAFCLLFFVLSSSCRAPVAPCNLEEKIKETLSSRKAVARIET
jgi:hypothetical protein